MITENLTKVEMKRRISDLREMQEEEFNEYRESNLNQLKEAAK